MSVESEENLEIVLDVLAVVSEGKEVHFSRMLLELIADLKEPLSLEEADESLTDIQVEEEGKYSEEIRILKEEIQEIQMKVASLIPKGVSEETLIDHLSPEIQLLYLEAQEKQKEIVEYQKKQQEEIKKEISESTWIRCLTITHYLLSNTTVGIRDAGIAGCLNDFILPAIQQTNEEVRFLAIKCLGLYTLLLLQSSDDVKKQEDAISILIRAFQFDTPKIRLAALQSIFDVMLILGRLVHSLSSINDSSSTSEDSYLPLVNLVVQVIEDFVKYIDLETIVNTQLKDKKKAPKKRGKSSKQEEMEESKEIEKEMKTSVIAVQGFAKLVFNDVCHVFHSPSKILGKLLVLFFGTGAKWVDPNDENDDENSIAEENSETGEEDRIKHKETKETIKQCLSVFFPSYSFSSYSHQKNIENIMLSTIERVYNNNDSTSVHLLTSQLQNMCKFVFFLTNPASCSSQSSNSTVNSTSVNLLHNEIMGNENIHGRIIVRLLHRILIKPKGEGKLLCKVLGGNLSILYLKKLHKLLVDYIQSLLSECQKEVVDKLCLKALQKFSQSIPSVPATNQDDSSPLQSVDDIDSYFKELEKQEGLDTVLLSTEHSTSKTKVPAKTKSNPSHTTRKRTTKKIEEESSESEEEDSVSEELESDIDTPSEGEDEEESSEAEQLSTDQDKSKDDTSTKNTKEEERIELESPERSDVHKPLQLQTDVKNIAKQAEQEKKSVDSRKSGEKVISSNQKKDDVKVKVKVNDKSSPSFASSTTSTSLKSVPKGVTETKTTSKVPTTTKPKARDSLVTKGASILEKKPPVKTNSMKAPVKSDPPSAKAAPKRTSDPQKPGVKASTATAKAPVKSNSSKTDANKENKGIKEKARIQKEQEVRQELEELDNLLDSDLPSTPPNKQKATKKILDEIDSLLDL